jgi:hypothetical protein
MEDEVADDVNAVEVAAFESARTRVPIDGRPRVNEYGAWIFWRFPDRGPRSR